MFKLQMYLTIITNQAVQVIKKKSELIVGHNELLFLSRQALFYFEVALVRFVSNLIEKKYNFIDNIKKVKSSSSLTKLRIFSLVAVLLGAIISVYFVFNAGRNN